MLRTLFRKLRESRYHYQHLVEIVVYKSNLLHNLNFFKKLTGLAVAPVLKSNAYGHGLIPVAQLLDSLSLPFMVVDTFAEALILKNERIKTNLLIAGYTDLNNLTQANIPGICYTIGSFDQLQDLIRSIKRPLDIALKIDTGMSRQGILVNELTQALELVRKNQLINVRHIFSHFADPENEPMRLEQIKAWGECRRLSLQYLPDRPIFHFAATASATYLKEFESDVIRLGLGLYGYDPNFRYTDQLRPALEMNSILCASKTISTGTHVGYGATYTATEDSKIGLVPAGYYEGIDLRLSNKGYFYYNDDACPIIGRVSMNMTSIDISHIKSIHIGEQINLISSSIKRKNSIKAISESIQTIPYEILVKIPGDLRRVYK